MALLHTLVLAAASLALVPQDDPSAPPADPAPADPAPAPADPAPAGDTPGGSDLKSVDAPAAAPEAKPLKPFSLARTGGNRPGKSPHAADMQLSAPPKVYIIPIAGQMGTDIHGNIEGKPSIYDKIIADVRTQDPDIIVFRVNSGDDRSPDKYMEAVRAQMKDDKIDPRRLASGLTEYRDLALKLHTDLDEYPAVVYVEDARGVASLFALAWSYMYMAPDGKIAGLDIVGSLGGGNDADIRAKMFGAWTGIAKGVLELGGHPNQLTDSLVRPDRLLSCDIDGRVTRWRDDTNGDWYVVDQSPEQSARFTSKVAEETGLADGVAVDLADMMGLLGYPEFVEVKSGQKIFDDYNALWRKRYEEVKKLIDEYRQEMEDARELPKRKQMLEKIRQMAKQYPPLARTLEWRFGLTDQQMQVLIEQLNEQIKEYQRQRRGTGGGSGGGGGGGGRGPMGPGPGR